MGVKRVVDTSFWTDGKVDEFSPEDKYFMLYLLTNPFSKQLGIYEISIKHVAFQLGYSVDAVKVLIDRFQNKYKIILFSEETNEIAILNFLRHSIVKGGKPVADCIYKEMSFVKDKSLIDAVFSRLQGRDGLNFTISNIINSYLNKKEKENEKENDNENDDDDENDNENDNDNERIVHDSYHDTSTIRPRIVENNSNSNQINQNDVLRTFNGNVMMSENQIGDLLDKFGLDAFDYYVKRVSDFINKGGYVKNPYQTILKWYEEDSGVSI